MKRSILSLVCLLLFPVAVQAVDLAGREAQSKAANAILDDWRKEHAEPVERVLHVVCWTPADREFPADHRARLSRMLLHIQAFYAREMNRNGFGEATFDLELDDAGLVRIHEVRGSDPEKEYANESGNDIRRECLPVLREAGIDADRETIAIFCNLANWDEQEMVFSHHSPYYAGGDFRRGTAWQLDSPELDTANLDKKEPMLRDAQYGRISLGRHNSIFIGGMAHELGHAFGLPHCRETGPEKELGTALMGSGNRTYGDELRGEGKGSFLTFDHALRLASHPMFSGYWAVDAERPQASLEDVAVKAEGTAIVVSGKVEGSPPIYGVVAYFDPDGGSDYDASLTSAVPDAEGRFELRADDLARGKKGMLRLVLLHADGAVTDRSTRSTMRFSYDVADDGTPDLTTIQIRQALAPVIAALNAGDRDSAAALAAKIDLPEAAVIAARLTDATRPTETPAGYSGDAASIDLTHLRPDESEVGWGQPAFDRVPEDSLALESGGEFYASGIYAHAPARHVYSLGGTWDRIDGRVGLAAGHEGSVEFTIRGDGRELWKSPVVESESGRAFDVDLSGVKTLELLVSPTADGTGSDWGLWLEPQLFRNANSPATREGRR